jgi:hypothetical protein
MLVTCQAYFLSVYKYAIKLIKGRNILEINMYRTLLLLGIFLSGNIFASNNIQNKIYSQEGYPYSNLIAKAEQIRIRYIDKDQGVECQVEVINNQQHWMLDKQWASTEDFAEKPFKSCVNRNTIKELLATLYQTE